MYQFLLCLFLLLGPSASHPSENTTNLRSWSWVHGADDDANSTMKQHQDHGANSRAMARTPHARVQTAKQGVRVTAEHKSAQGRRAQRWHHGEQHTHARVSGRKPKFDWRKPYYDADEFLRSEVGFDWALFGAAVCIYWAVRTHRLSCCSGVVGSLALWVLLGIAFNAVMFVRWGDDTGFLWLDGYVMELIFSMENAVLFLSLAEVFAVPVLAMHRVLVLAVVWQNLFDLVLYMGLATTLDTLSVLPYVLGAWLLIAGLHSMRESLHRLRTLPSIFSDRSSWTGEEARLVKSPSARFSARQEACHLTMRSFPIRAFRSICGGRFTDNYDPHDPSLFVVKNSEGEELQASMLLLVAVSTILADCLLEVDVTLTKIETLQEPFVCFTSSALASFAMPELVLVTWKLSRRCPLVTVGVSIILILFGVEMLLKDLIGIGPLDECAFMVIVLVMFIVVSEIGAIYGRGY